MPDSLLDRLLGKEEADKARAHQERDRRRRALGLSDPWHTPDPLPPAHAVTASSAPATLPPEATAAVLASLVTKAVAAQLPRLVAQLLPVTLEKTIAEIVARRVAAEIPAVAAEAVADALDGLEMESDCDL